MFSSATHVARRWLPLAALLLAALPARSPLRGDDPPAAAPVSGVLIFSNGNLLSGALADSAGPGELGWLSPAFERPFQFDAKLLYLREARFAGPHVSAWAENDYCLGLGGGDVLYGSLVAVTASDVVLESSQAGRVRVKRAAIRRIERARKNAALLYAGPNGVGEWRSSPRPDAWRDDGGGLAADQPSAALYRDFELPPRAMVEFELSWNSAPDFVLSLGAGEDPAAKWPACSLEVIAGELVVERETERDLDVAKVERLEAEGRLHLRVLVDQERQEVDVFSGGGALLASVRTSKDASRVLPGIYLQHKRGGLRLDRLRVSRLQGAAPRELVADRPRIERADGTVVYGEVSRYDAQRREFIVATADGEATIAEDQIDGIHLAQPAEGAEPRARIACADGTRLSGTLDRVEGDRLVLECSAAVGADSLDALTLPVAAVRDIRFLHKTAPPTRSNRGALALELDGGTLHGTLASASAEESRGRLFWQPLGSSTASPLRHDVSGRIDFSAKRLPGRPTVEEGDADKLYLRAGDIFRCEITRIDADGVSFRNGGAAVQQVANAKLKAVELGGLQNPVAISPDKRERLLTLPRLLKADPPTHILGSTNGDYLRGRLLDVGDRAVRFEVNANEREFPRALIARIIWLHADELDASGEAPPAAAPLAGRVQVVRIDGTRVTLTPVAYQDGWLSGESELLGPCRVHIDEESELLIGDRVLRHAAELPYSQWRLASAVEPIAARAGATADAAEDGGLDSPLSGRPAPDFALTMLDGSRFSLSDERGKIVVLDFWASWCAPCMQGLPPLAKMVGAIEGDRVKLVAVNLQETPAEAEDALRRLKLTIPVALDREGQVAEKYGATSIPYTVVVGPDGKVSRVFIGGSPRLAEQLRKTIDELPSPEAPASEPR
ncbi:MAG TPA: redoxin domain-containing protein [Pirellulales bacterium]|nr:redoxin domain-containing protein [Pirellulales bacterium]